MLRRLFTRIGLLLIAFTLGRILQPFNRPTTFAQSGCQTFAETGKLVCGRFLEYWQQNGGVTQQGYPISNEFQEISDLDGHTYTVQYFERAEFEKHPENQPPYDVLLSQLGNLQYHRKYPNVGSTGGDQSSLPSQTVGRFFSAMRYDGGVAIIIQQSLLSKRLSSRVQGDPYYGLLGSDFPGWKTLQNAPRTDFSVNGPAWVLLLDGTGSTVAVFTLVKEDGAWKIDYVEPNVLTK